MDGSVWVAMQEEETLGGVEDDVVLEEGKVGSDERARGTAEEEQIPAKMGVAGVEAVALGQQHLAAWVEARIDETATAWADGAGFPVGADSSEADIV